MTRFPLSPRTIGALFLAGCALFAARLWLTPAWPDDWDGIGFALSIDRFDLASFRPHPPGYPVYVALLRLANAFCHSPLLAGRIVAALTGSMAVALLAGTAVRRSGPRAGLATFALLATAPLVSRCSTAIGSEAPAFLCVALAVACAPSSPLLTGIAVGLGLGVRLSWGALFLPLLFLVAASGRKRALMGLLGATASWAIPFILVVGPTHVVPLITEHARGHFETWGGTVFTAPGAIRAVWFLRDMFVDGLGVDIDPLGILLTLSLALLLLERTRNGEAKLREQLVPMTAIVLYAAWVLVGQNLQQQPRHVLPIVVALLLFVVDTSTTERRGRWLLCAFVGLMTARTFSDSLMRLRVPPAGVQMLSRVSSDPELRELPLFAGPSARFAELTDIEPARLDPRGGELTHAVGSRGDVLLSLSRMRVGARSVLVADDIVGFAPIPKSMRRIDQFCRPPRLDRRAPCVSVYVWPAPFRE